MLLLFYGSVCLETLVGDAVVYYVCRLLCAGDVVLLSCSTGFFSAFFLLLTMTDAVFSSSISLSSTTFLIDSSFISTSASGLILPFLDCRLTNFTAAGTTTTSLLFLPFCLAGESMDILLLALESCLLAGVSVIEIFFVGEADEA